MPNISGQEGVEAVTIVPQVHISERMCEQVQTVFWKIIDCRKREAKYDKEAVEKEWPHLMPFLGNRLKDIQELWALLALKTSARAKTPKLRKGEIQLLPGVVSLKWQWLCLERTDSIMTQTR